MNDLKHHHLIDIKLCKARKVTTQLVCWQADYKYNLLKPRGFNFLLSPAGDAVQHARLGNMEELVITQNVAIKMDFGFLFLYFLF